ncbi:MAG: TerB family tellurite resistance protein [Bacteroidales bacterium]|nr:TerB family tellurite resistance protein [Bacteroidales bacterium]
MGAIKWIGGVLGWALGGPLGGLLGFFVGRMFEGLGQAGSQNDTYYYDETARRQARPRPTTHEGDFGVSLLVLSAAVMKADGEVKRSELDYVKAFFKRQFGQQKAEQYILMLRELLKKDYPVDNICRQIRYAMDLPSRLQLLHYLFGIAQSDGSIHPTEAGIIRTIANGLGISQKDYESIQAMFVKKHDSAYRILEITPEATDEEVKKAYKKMAVKYHPDKVSHLGEDVQRQAKEKFQEVNAAYEQIKKERGMV